MRRKEERSKQGQTVKQGKATQHTQGSMYSVYDFCVKHMHYAYSLKSTVFATISVIIKVRYIYICSSGSSNFKGFASCIFPIYHMTSSNILIINPRRACAARVTVVVLCVSLSKLRPSCSCTQCLTIKWFRNLVEHYKVHGVTTRTHGLAGYCYLLQTQRPLKELLACFRL